MEEEFYYYVVVTLDRQSDYYGYDDVSVNLGPTQKAIHLNSNTKSKFLMDLCNDYGRNYTLLDSLPEYFQKTLINNSKCIQDYIKEHDKLLNRLERKFKSDSNYAIINGNNKECSLTFNVRPNEKLSSIDKDLIASGMYRVFVEIDPEVILSGKYLKKYKENKKALEDAENARKKRSKK